ncbi:YjeF [Peptoclostridium acidaminophilum DSM 3953]|uniref:Bifunctional NAD(P)H-hydrate repair enzyme n=1 Tax=Peptoclostridium acidaminophilum DSM 3953 TaxID=1286171 RepID=W8TEI7_PEPAC|nr:bifunctional ADP-dependent NAD(P)H-hydrate dehydratase/NAD(P)H-hydrate epimerase [Peptoclostridium acidaminophilum]AHM56223.1 YjeF [Peptoclostridium acidaminophilum DSM 3953]
MKKIAYSFEMRNLDKTTIEAYGIPGAVLMENAGRKTYEQIEELAGNEKKILVVCGRGNNGGDGYVIARHLHNNGYTVSVSLIGGRDGIKGDALLNLEIIERMGIQIDYIANAEDFAAVLKRGYDIIVDAIFGIGIDRKVAQPFAEIIELINSYEKKELVVAVDLPSGLNTDTGEIMGSAVQSDITVTFGALKPANIFNEGINLCGKTVVADISIPRELLEAERKSLLESGFCAGIIRRRKCSSHKGTYGKVGIVGGSLNMPGAAILSSRAAMRMGSGIVNVFADCEAFSALSGKTPEVIVVKSDYSRPKDVTEELAGLDAVLVGPGLSKAAGRRELLLEVLSAYEGPLAIDADGLNLLQGELGTLRGKNAIITPHIGEMARLAGKESSFVSHNAMEVAREFAAEYGCVVVLKSASTVIALPEGEIFVCSSPNPGMATAGSGDVLSGAIVSLLGQGYEPREAALLGVHIHSLAGRLALYKKGEYGLLAGDIVEEMPEAVKGLLEIKDGF